MKKEIIQQKRDVLSTGNKKLVIRQIRKAID